MATAYDRLRRRRVSGTVAVPPWLVLVAAPALGQVAQLLWLVASSRTMTAEAFGTVLGAQALYMALQVVVNAGSWLYGARVAAVEELSEDARAQTTRVRLELALLGAVASAAFAAVAGGMMAQAVLPYAVALLLFALMNTWEPFGSGRRTPYLIYIAFRAVVPALAASVLLLAAAEQPVVVPGLAECATILVTSAVFRLIPLRHIRRVLETRSGRWAGILRVSLPQIAAQVVAATGTLTLSLVGAAAKAGMFAAGIKVLGGFTTLVTSAALDSFRGIAQQTLAHADDLRRPRTGLTEMVTTLSWLSLALMSALALAAPVLSVVLLDDASRTSVTTMMAVLSAIPPAGFVAALTGPLTARGEEAALGATFVLGIAVMSVGAGLVLLGFGAAPAEMAVALVAAQAAMTIHMVPQARAVLGGASVSELLLRVNAGATIGLIATFAPSLRVPLLTLLLMVSSVRLVAWSRRLLRSRGTPAVEQASETESPGSRTGARSVRWLTSRAALALAGAPGGGGRLPLVASLIGLARRPGATPPPAGAEPARSGAASAELSDPPAARTQARLERAHLKPPRLLPCYARAVLTRARTLPRRGRALGDPGQLRILFYHRIAAGRDLLAVKPGAFARQMDLLSREGYTVLDVATAWDRFAAGDGGERLIALSFDDGYRDFGELAVPVLERYGFGATVFVCPGLIDGTAAMSWYDDPPPLLAWDAIVALDGKLVRFEPHSITHPNLTALDEECARQEIRESRLVLEHKLGRPAAVFCYPGGFVGRREQALVREAGLRLATTCDPGVAGPTVNPLALPRTAVQFHDSLTDFRAKLAGVHDEPLPGRALYQRLRYSVSGGAKR